MTQCVNTGVDNRAGMNWMSGAAKWQKLSKVQTPAAQSFEGIVWSGSYGGCVVPTTCRSFTVAYAQDAVAACGMAWRRSMAARIAADVACGRRLASTSAMLELPPGAITALSVGRLRLCRPLEAARAHGWRRLVYRRRSISAGRRPQSTSRPFALRPPPHSADHRRRTSARAS